MIYKIIVCHYTLIYYIINIKKSQENVECQKIKNTLLVFADTKGKTNSKEEVFHYTSAVWLENPMSLTEAIKGGLIVIEFAMESVDGKLHDRGVKFRISKKNLYKMFKDAEFVE